MEKPACGQGKLHQDGSGGFQSAWDFSQPTEPTLWALVVRMAMAQGWLVAQWHRHR